MAPKVGIQLCPFRVWWCLAPWVRDVVWPAPCRLKLIVIMAQVEQGSGEPAHLFWNSKWYTLSISEIHGTLGTISRTTPFWSGTISYLRHRSGVKRGFRILQCNSSTRSWYKRTNQPLSISKRFRWRHVQGHDLRNGAPGADSWALLHVPIQNWGVSCSLQ